MINISSTALITIKKKIVIKKVHRFLRINSKKMRSPMKKQVMLPKVRRTIQIRMRKSVNSSPASKANTRVRTIPARRTHQTSNRCQVRFKAMKPITYQKSIAMKEEISIYRISKEVAKMTHLIFQFVKVQ